MMSECLPLPYPAPMAVAEILPVALDRSSPVPLYHQLAQQLIDGIEQGRVKPGDPFENELAMGDRLKLSRPTVRRAIGELVHRGLLVRRRGIGTVVASRIVHRRAELTSLFDDLSAHQLRPTTTILSFEPEVVDAEVALELGLPGESGFVSFSRLRYADDTPLAVMRNWLPLTLPGVAELTSERLEAQGLYSILRSLGIRPSVARQSFAARNPAPDERRLLGIGVRDPVLTMTRRAHASDGTAVEYGVHCYRGDHYSIDVVVFDV